MAYRISGNFVERVYTSVAQYAANANVQFQLTTASIVKELQFRLAGTLTLAGYTAPPVKRVESIENLISMLRITGNGKITGAQAADFNATDAAYMAFRTRLMEGTAPSRVDVGTGNAAYAFSSTFKKYFGAKRSGSADLYESCFIDTRNLSTFTANFQFRDVGAMIQPGTGTGGTATLSGTTVTVLSREYQDAPGTIRAPYVRESQRRFDLSNLSGTDRDFLNAPVGNLLPRQTFKTTVGDVDYADPSDTVIATTQRLEGAHMSTVEGANFSWMFSTADHLRDDDKTKYNLESFPSGYLVAEYTGNTKTPMGLDLSRATLLKNVLDITTTAGSTCTLQITDEEVVFYKGQ